MTKYDIIKQIKEKEEEKHFHFTDCNMNCSKSMLLSFLECIECTDELLDDYFTVFKLVYPNSAKAAANNGNWKLHNFNRYYIFSTAKMILNNK